MTNKLKNLSEKKKRAARLAIFPERPAIIAVKKVSLDILSAEKLGADDLLEEIFAQTEAIQKGDMGNIERHLYSQAIALSGLFSRMLSQIGSVELIPQVQVFSSIALKAQAQCRVTLATLAEIRNPQRATFIKQQNNATNQQVNNAPTTESSKKIENNANELLSEAKHEALDTKRTQETIRINPNLAPVEKIHRR